MVSAMLLVQRPPRLQLLLATFAALLCGSTLQYLLALWSTLRPGHLDSAGGSKLRRPTPVGYRIRTTGCTMPQFDPFDPTMKPYYRRRDDHSPCHGKPNFLHIRDGYPMVLSDKLREHGVILEDLVCYYKEIYRNESLKKPDEEYLYGSRKRLLFGELLQKEFLFVECATRQSPDKPFHERFLFNPLFKKTIEERCSIAFGTPHNMSVLVLGLDSVSYLNFDRQLPETAKFVREKLDAFELYGYNKRAPADYYLRPIVMAMDDSPKITEDWQRVPCLGLTMPFVERLDYLAHFTNLMAKRPFFSYTWIIDIAHNLLNSAGYADEPFRRHLETLLTSGTLNHTVLVLLSDHGMRFGENRATYIGKFEDRQPFAFIVFPPWFLQKNPEAAQSLRTNQHRLTTPFDIHATLVELLDYPNAQQPNSTYGLSLLHHIPDTRTCANASIARHWCVCDARADANVTGDVALKLAKHFVANLNEWVSEGGRKCEEYRLLEIIDVTPLRETPAERPENASHYWVTIKLSPGAAVFEGTEQQVGILIRAGTP
ncbi:hypothetical protein MRX96_011967 [Rhipicephalus microplus]